ncbi:MAG: guanylate kinase [Paludibacteraceae bacterium]|nr:guanylate kinase [Paludibacteraceae bacterium]
MILIFSAPSGSGKSTLVHYLLENRNDLEFSVSCTTRQPRGKEEDGVDYYFISNAEFERLIREGAFVEYEKVYAGTYYGTLKSEIERIEKKGHNAVFDVDVMGGMNLKRIFGEKALSVFVAPPSVDELRNRLIKRATDTPEKIEERIAKAEVELREKDNFDIIIVNDNLEKAEKELLERVNKFLTK